ncbi:YjcZ family sporulation protein [Haloplasma contractile]|uniref:YjcZ family sporulation protein n=1 Tax=Haloplasma contractile SSD-17B TaxID=1033810 RepID=U2FF05_9MOLU|nr:YjcZ family sporulation protein [Haloplasma contractile]ERJ11505.1 hypothetical protein HLPCO_002417 [Haloplasma contractile SSD-17B]
MGDGYHTGTYAFILVLFILLVIVGCSCYGGYDGYGY